MGPTPDAVRRLASPYGEALLVEAGLLPSDPLTRIERLRKNHSPEMAAAAVEMLILRKRAGSKFTHAETLFFTREALEQSTGERLAALRARRFPQNETVLDACCSVGGDALALLRRGPALGIDTDETRLLCAHYNARAAGVSEDFRLIETDAETLPLAHLKNSGIRSAFCDPSRRTEAAGGRRRRVVSLQEMAPSLPWLQHLRETFPFTVFKLGPATDPRPLAGKGDKAEYTGEGGECRELVLWCKEAAQTIGQGYSSSEGLLRCATVLTREGEGRTLFPMVSKMPPLVPPQEWLYEPHPAVLAAGLAPTMAALLQAAPLEPDIPYLTSSLLTHTPFAAAYRVIETMPCRMKELKQRLKKLGRRAETVKRRGVPIEPEEALRQLADRDLLHAPPITLVLTRVNGNAIALLCEREAEG